MEKKNPDQVQAIYLAQANIFAYEARKSAKSWVPLCDSTVPISILYDNTRSIYRIISVDADIKEVVVNTTVIPELEFVKTTQKFGYWKDIASGRVFGIGFASEYEAEAFDECLRKVKQNIGPPSANSSVSLNSESNDDFNNNNNNSNSGNNQNSSNSKSGGTSYSNQQQQRYQQENAYQGQGDGPPNNSNKVPQVVAAAVVATGSNNNNTTNSSSKPTQQQPQQYGKNLNWDDFEQIGPAVLSMMNSRQQGIPNGCSRPSTYKVDLPVINSSSGMTHPSNQQQQENGGATGPIPKYYQNLDFRLPAPPAYHPVPPTAYQYIPQQQGRPPNSHQDNSGNVPPPPTVPPRMMPFSMPIPPGYCYHGPTSTAATSLADQYLNVDLSTGGIKQNSNSSSSAANATNDTRRDVFDEINRVKSENMKLTESLLETTCNAKKWELQVNSLREDNIQLVKSVADLNMKLEAISKECQECKEQAGRWKEHYQQAVNSAKEKGQHLKDAEDKLKSASVDRARIENVMKELEEELKRQQAIHKEAAANHMGQYTNKYFKELEEHYRKLLTDSQKRIEEVLRKDNDRKNVLRGVDTLFTGAIQGLINIHGQIRQAYEQ